ncbi:MAG: hypothetical protein K1X74_19580 [Pirellulales bacterium]|nr:hypothetical protein [Pirellulales bacterium]
MNCAALVCDARGFRLRGFRFGMLACGLSLLGLAGWSLSAVTAAERTNDDAEQLELFAAIKAGQVDVKFIPRNDKQARLLVKNLTDKPINVRLPDAFAGVPVLNQFGGGGGGAGGAGGGGGSQGVGGGGGGGFGGGGGGQFNIPPEKVGEARLATVCLEHGKPVPRPNIPYEIRPLDDFTTSTGVRELLQAFSAGQVDQRAAQAAAWHLNNGLSWEELAAKRIEHVDGTSEPYFSPAEIHAAIAATRGALEQAAAAEKRKTSGSLSGDSDK